MAKFPAQFAIKLCQQVGLVDESYIESEFCHGNSDGWPDVLYIRFKHNGKYYTGPWEEYKLQKLDEGVIDTYQKLADQLDVIEQFQKFSMTVDFELSIKMFQALGHKIGEKEKELLELVHDMTPAWVAGELTEELMKRIKVRTTNSREAAAVATVLKDLIETGDIPEKQKGAAAGIVKSFYMELAGE